MMNGQQMMDGVARSWHQGGLFMGMHWVWWAVWVLTIAMILWAFWRLHVERRDVHRNAVGREAAEDELRLRFARGEIDEEELARRLKVLRETNPAMRGH